MVLHRVHSHCSPRISPYRGFADALAIAAASALSWSASEGEVSWLLHLAVVAIGFPALIVGAIQAGWSGGC
jgi:hypothetical protein